MFISLPASFLALQPLLLHIEHTDFEEKGKTKAVFLLLGEGGGFPADEGRSRIAASAAGPCQGDSRTVPFLAPVESGQRWGPAGTRHTSLTDPVTVNSWNPGTRKHSKSAPLA